MRQGISITEQDLPVSGAYLDSLIQYPLRILYTSKWMNAAVIRTGDSALAQVLYNLSFITDVEYLYRYPWKKKSAVNKTLDPFQGQEPQAAQLPEILMDETLVSDHQVKMLQGQSLHQMGYEGQGLIIAVLDAGFGEANLLPGLDSLFNGGRILGTRSFIEPDSAFFRKWNGFHGNAVLSVMGGDVDSLFRGTAPKAAYWLIETEDIRSEFRVEEANWVAGAELADSAGADIINSSLGYSNKYTESLHNYTYPDMDGKTTLSSRAAEIASSKGILVVASAGNQGKPDDPWKYIGAPADAENVLTVGAVSAEGKRADFSSRGPSYDGRIKPDIMAQGVGTWFIDSNGAVKAGNGTSFSAPVVSGLAACLWQKNPDISNFELMDAIRSSSALNPYPNNLYGYGIPNMAVADFIIRDPDIHDTILKLFPNPCKEIIFIGGDHVYAWQVSGTRISYNILDPRGRTLISGELSIRDGKTEGIPVNFLAPGTYFIRVESSEAISTGIFTKI